MPFSEVSQKIKNWTTTESNNLTSRYLSKRIKTRFSGTTRTPVFTASFPTASGANRLHVPRQMNGHRQYGTESLLPTSEYEDYSRPPRSCSSQSGRSVCQALKLPRVRSLLCPKPEPTLCTADSWEQFRVFFVFVLIAYCQLLSRHSTNVC